MKGVAAENSAKLPRRATPMMKAAMALGTAFNLFWLWCLPQIVTPGEVIYNLVLAFILADIVSGIYHWFQDSYRCKSEAINQALFENFQLHHALPHLIAKHDWEYVSWELGAASVVGNTLAILYTGEGEYSEGWIMFRTFWVFGTYINHVHRCAHIRNLGYPIPWPLQSAKHHAIHHHRPELRSYCILSVLNNGWMDFVGVFPAAEWALYQIFGAVSFRMVSGRAFPDTPPRKILTVYSWRILHGGVPGTACGRR
jgi:hypothetical protein